VLPAAMLAGMLAARHRLLDDPARHLPTLRRLAVVGLPIGWGFGVLQAMVHLGVVALPNPVGLVGTHAWTGFLAGIGYAALFGLLAHRITARGTALPAPVRGLVALGRRSLSGYLAQSVVFVLLLSAWGAGLGAHLTSWSAALVAVATWLVTVLAAAAMDRRGVRGPAEVALRRLTYGSARG
jgi:uncharacterized protein